MTKKIINKIKKGNGVSILLLEEYTYIYDDGLVLKTFWITENYHDSDEVQIEFFTIEEAKNYFRMASKDLIIN